MPGDPRGLEQGYDVGRAVAAQGRDGEAGILGNEAVGRGMQIREIAAAAAGYADLLTRRGRVVEHQHAPAAPRRLDRAHHAGRPGPDHHHVVGLQAAAPPRSALRLHSSP